MDRLDTRGVSKIIQIKQIGAKMLSLLVKNLREILTSHNSTL